MADSSRIFVKGKDKYSARIVSAGPLKSLYIKIVRCLKMLVFDESLSVGVFYSNVKLNEKKLLAPIFIQNIDISKC